jgi:ribosomal protein L11 methyltransferase
VDIDEWAYTNALENIAANGVQERVEAIKGGVESIAERRYDVILANINLNILVRDMAAYVRALEDGGQILFSGILPHDLPALSAAAVGAGLTIVGHTEKEGWVCLATGK